jgi:hypothetical protein
LRAICPTSSWPLQQYVRAPARVHSRAPWRQFLTRTQPLIAYFVIRNLLARLDPEAAQKEEARAKATAATRKLGAILSGKRRGSSGGDYDSDEETESRGRRARIQELNLNTYEQTIAMEVVAPEEIPVTFEGMSRAEEAYRLQRKHHSEELC